MARFIYIKLIMNLDKPFKSIVLLLLVSFLYSSCSSKKERILVFSKTEGYRHESIPVGKLALIDFGKDLGVEVDTTENADYFIADSLKKYSAVVFLNTTMDILNDTQQKAFEGYIKTGKGFLGIHAAADTEYEWSYYGELLGAYFQSHPKIQEAEFYVTDRSNPATDSLPDRFKREDELYNYKNINPDIHVIVKIDESSYEGGENGTDHPFVWYHEYDGGRAFYTGMGHTNESYSDPLFVNIVKGGLLYVLGKSDLQQQ